MHGKWGVLKKKYPHGISKENIPKMALGTTDSNTISL